VTDTLELRRGPMYPVDAGWSVAVWFLSNPALDGQPQQVELVVVDPDELEHDLRLRIGDRFGIGPVTWQLRAVDGVGTGQSVVHLVRVGGDVTGQARA
jgi:hypothetical protein